MTSYTEIKDYHEPALVLLQKLGWKYITSEQTVLERGEIVSRNSLKEKTFIGLK